MLPRAAEGPAAASAGLEFHRSPAGRLGWETSSMQPPKTSYAKAGDLNIAYQVLGEGPIDLVYV
jgi:hypothetical protein